MGKKVYSFILIGLGVALLVDLFFPDHHHVIFAWHTIPGFDIFYGFVGCLALMAGSLALGDLWLWRDTCSVIVDSKDVGDAFDSGYLEKLYVAPGDQVTAGQKLAVVVEGDSKHNVHAPYEGVVAEIFTDANQDIRLGETVLNLRVSKRTAEQMHHEAQDADCKDADCKEADHA